MMFGSMRLVYGILRCAWDTENMYNAIKVTDGPSQLLNEEPT